MSDNVHSRQIGNDADVRDRVPEASDPYADICALARANSNELDRLRECLKVIARYFGSPYAAVHVCRASEVIQDDWHFGPTDPQFWKSSVQDFLTESLTEARPRAKLLRAKSNGETIAFLSAPVFDGPGASIGAVALVTGPVQRSEIATHLAKMEGLVRLASQVIQRFDEERAAGGAEHATVHVAAQAASYETVDELAFAITNELRNKLACEQVALGLVNRKSVRIASISGFDSVHRQSPGVVRVRAAMEECLDAGTPIICQQGEQWVEDGVNVGYRIHKQWYADAKGSSVASLPLCDGRKTVAVLSIRKPPGALITSEDIAELKKQIEPVIPAITLTRRATRGLPRHALDRAADLCERLAAPGRAGARAAVFCALLASLWFFFGPMDYELTVRCVMAPSQTRHIAAPFDGIIASAPVVEGDRVRQGEVLCEIDHGDLDVRAAALEAELAVLERTRDRAMADDSPVEVQLALANQQLTRAKLEIVRRRIRQATLVAPFDGIVVGGDLRRRVGSVVARGEPLFEVAPTEQMTLRIHVPESISAELAAGLGGSYACHARPEEVREFEISRVFVEARTHERRNVYVAEAQIPSPGEWMRPGMEGTARIHVGTRRVYWVALHKVFDYLRMNLWL